MENENIYELPVWEHPADYGGFSPDGDYVIYSQTRDSDALERSNYECILNDLQECAEKFQTDDSEPFVYDFRADHWAVGWVETIIVDRRAPDEVQQMASEILAALSDYPVYNESHYSELEWNEVAEYWENMCIQDRIELCADNDISIMAARRDYLPPDDNGSLFDALRD